MSVIDVPTGLSLFACAIGAGLGVYAMINPQWAANLVRLRDDPARPGGGAEFRATYGGLFLGVHGVAIALLLGPDRAMATGAVLALAAAWGATAVGRLLSMALDPPSRTGFNGASAGFEIVVAAMIVAPAVRLLG